MSDSLLQYLISGGGYISTNKAIARDTDLNTAALFGELISLSSRFGKDEFYYTYEELNYSTTLTHDAIRKSAKKLCEIGVISVTRKGMPCKTYYKINTDECLAYIKNIIEKENTEDSQILKFRKSKRRKNSTQDVEKATLKTEENNNSSERENSTQDSEKIGNMTAENNTTCCGETELQNNNAIKKENNNLLNKEHNKQEREETTNTSNTAGETKEISPNFSLSQNELNTAEEAKIEICRSIEHLTALKYEWASIWELSSLGSLKERKDQRIALCNAILSTQFDFSTCCKKAEAHSKAKETLNHFRISTFLQRLRQLLTEGDTELKELLEAKYERERKENAAKRLSLEKEEKEKEDKKRMTDDDLVIQTLADTAGITTDEVHSYRTKMMQDSALGRFTYQNTDHPDYLNFNLAMYIAEKEKLKEQKFNNENTESEVKNEL